MFQAEEMASTKALRWECVWGVQITVRRQVSNGVSEGESSGK